MILFLGDGCADKPLATLWTNYTSNEKPKIVMKVTVCQSGKHTIIIDLLFAFSSPELYDENSI